MITLYDYWRSSASYRLRIALGLAGLEWETVTIDLLSGEHKSGDHLQRNPQGLVPVLEIDGHQFTQSIAILEYLEETRDLGWLPKNPVDRAHVRALTHAIAMEIHPVCNVSVARFAAENSDGGITMASWMREFIPPRLEAVEAMLKGGSHCFGDDVTLADICLVPQLYNARRWECDLSGIPNLTRIDTMLNEVPAFAAAHPDRTPH